MPKTVVGLFDDMKDADAVVRDLVEAGASREHISVIRTGADTFAENYGTPMAGTTASGAAVGGTTTTVGGLLSGGRRTTLAGIGPVHASGPLATALERPGVSHGLIDELATRGVSADDARFYAEGVRRGSTLVLLRVLDEDAEEVADIMENHGAIDIETRSGNWRTRGWKGFDVKAQPFTRDEFTREREACRLGVQTHTTATPAAPVANRTTKEGDMVLPVVEEELQVGKRAVRRGVRLVQEVHERPVEETIRLREERVRIERRPVNREVASGRVEDLKDRVIEVTETAEEAVVGKTARVKEEVVVHKDTQIREEKVRGTVKSTDVRVEETNVDPKLRK